MDKEHFDQLVKAVRQMNRHMAGKVVRGAKTTDGDGRLGDWEIAWNQAPSRYDPITAWMLGRKLWLW